jgi:hypothetical protein
VNERIRELWDRAAESTAAFPSGQNNSWETQVNFMEKFAELIVRHCAFTVRMTEFGVNMTQEQIARHIEDHFFGVE